MTFCKDVRLLKLSLMSLNPLLTEYINIDIYEISPKSGTHCSHFKSQDFCRILQNNKSKLQLEYDFTVKIFRNIRKSENRKKKRIQSIEKF